MPTDLYAIGVSSSEMVTLATPERLLEVWQLAEQQANARGPDVTRKQAIDQELARRGFFRRMFAASKIARSGEFEARLNAAAEERAAARDEADLAALMTRILVALGADMTDLHIRLRRVTQREIRKEGYIGHRAQLKFRITPTLAAAREAIAAVDGYASDLGEAAAAVCDSVDSDGQAGQGPSVG
jgi:hypothetical protein